MKTTTIIKAIIFVISIFAISSCSNDDAEESNGTSTGNFLPLAINNTWNYNAQNQSSLNEVKIIGRSQFNGVTYYQFTDNSQAAFGLQQWFTKRGAIYLLKTGKTSVVENGINIDVESYELPILRDDFEVNRSWTGRVSPKVTFSVNGQTGTLPFKIDYSGVNLFKGPLTFNGTNYPNVIKTILSMTINANNQITTATEEYWFAENIGIIKIITNSNSSIIEKDIVSYFLN